MIDSFHKNQAVAISGTCQFVEFNTQKNTFLNIYQLLNMHIYNFVYRHYWLSGFNFGIYKEIYDKSDGFNNELNVQEDTDLAFRVSKLGNIKFETTIPVIVSGRRFKTGIILGILPYYSSFFKYKVFKKKDIILPDTR